VTVFLYENIQVVPGQTAEYIRGFGDRWLPLSDEYDRDLYRISGFFTPDVLNTSHPAVTALWTIDSWETWDKRHARGTPTERLIKTSEFYMPALTWRSGWTDKMLESLPFSPTPPSRSDSVRPGSIAIVHRFLVAPTSCSSFVEAFERDVVPAASGVRLNLELFARAIGRPTEYFAFWTIAAGDDYTSWRNGRKPIDEHGILPGVARCWSMLVDAEEQEMTPAWFSPIGGSQQNPREPTEENLSI
jgi:hypothetical protein